MKVEGAACDRVQEGTGFVAAPGLIVTNAHVVAGEQRTRVVTPDGRRLDTEVVAFDPNRDLAVLQRARARRCRRSRAATATSTIVGSLFGHPGGGPLRESPMRIAEQIVARGTNIEHTAATRARGVRARRGHRARRLRRARRRPDGKVVGVLFAFDLSRDTTAYALTSTELDAVLEPVLAGTAPTPSGTGPCLND